MDSYPAHRLLTGREITRHRLRGLQASKQHQKLNRRSMVARSKWLLGSAPARLLRLLRARLVALGSPALPVRGPGHWVPSHCLGCSSQPPPKSPISPPLTIQVRQEFELREVGGGLRLCRAEYIKQ